MNILRHVKAAVQIGLEHTARELHKLCNNNINTNLPITAVYILKCNVNSCLVCYLFKHTVRTIEDIYSKLILMDM
jgi:hypothetical protein